MRSATWLRRAGWLGVFSLAVGAITTAGADEPPKGKVAAQEESDESRPATELLPRLQRRVRLGTDLINDLEHTLQYSGKYTLQVGLSTVPKSLDAQLNLNSEGMLVSSIRKDGPAEKAGLQVFDILARVADEPIKKMTDVVNAVNESDGKELTFKVLRAGEPIEITITPEARTNGATFDIDRRHVEAAQKAATDARRTLELQLSDLEKSIREKLKDAGVDVRMQVIQPGRFIPEGRIWSPAKTTDFPDDLTIDIRKQGKGLATIEVQQGDKAWTVTEDKLGELPEDLRQHVKSLLGRGGARFSIVETKRSEEAFQRAKVAAAKARDRAKVEYAEAHQRATEAAEAARDRAAHLRERLGDRLEHRLDELSREMKEMRERMEELRRSLHEQAEAAAEEVNEDNKAVESEEEDDKPAEKQFDGEV